jgi:hypothetical protein
VLNEAKLIKIEVNTISKILKDTKEKYLILTFKRSEFKTTETLLKAIASPASSGFKKNQKLRKTQAATGIQSEL